MKIKEILRYCVLTGMGRIVIKIGFNTYELNRSMLQNLEDDSLEEILDKPVGSITIVDNDLIISSYKFRRRTGTTKDRKE